MQSTINTLRQYLLSRKVNWLEALLLALWGLNDLPGAVAPYSPQRLVFGRDPIGVGDLPPVDFKVGNARMPPNLLRGWLGKGSW